MGFEIRQSGVRIQAQRSPYSWPGCFSGGAVASFEEQACHTLHRMVSHISGPQFPHREGVLSFLPQCRCTQLPCPSKCLPTPCSDTHTRWFSPSLATCSLYPVLSRDLCVCWVCGLNPREGGFQLSGLLFLKTVERPTLAASGARSSGSRSHRRRPCN